MVESVESVLEESEHIIFVFEGRLWNNDILQCVALSICTPSLLGMSISTSNLLAVLATGWTGTPESSHKTLLVQSFRAQCRS